MPERIELGPGTAIRHGGDPNRCAVLLPGQRRAHWIHVLYRLILFKLYFESGRRAVMGGDQRRRTQRTGDRG